MRNTFRCLTFWFCLPLVALSQIPPRLESKPEGLLNSVGQDLPNTYYLGQVIALKDDAKNLEFIISPKFDKVLLWEPAKRFSLIDEKTLVAAFKANKSVTSVPIEWGAQTSSDLLSAYGLAWSSDNMTINFRSKGEECEGCYFSVNTSLEKPVRQTKKSGELFAKGIDPRELYGLEKRVVIFDKVSKQIKAFVLNDPDRLWNVSRQNANYYNILVSPDGKFVVCNRGPNMIVMSTDPERSFEKNLGPGIPTSWAPKDYLILYYLDEGDGHEITESNIYVVDLLGENRSLLNVKATGKVYTNAKWVSKDLIIFREEAKKETLLAEIKKSLNVATK